MRLNIIACVKSVLNNALPGQNRRASESMELNPFDRPAIELALSLIKEHQGTLTVISMGPKPATFGLYQAIAMGANRAILICDPALRESDTYVTARVLGSALQRLTPFDLALFGTRSSDSDTGHVGPQTAQMLNIPFVGNIHSLTMDASDTDSPSDPERLTLQSRRVTVERKSDGYLESFEVRGCAAFTVSSAFGESNFTSLHGIETAFSDNRKIEFWNNSTVGLEPHETGLAASPTKIVAWNKQRRSKKCLFIEGSPEQKAEELAQRLSEAGFVG